MNETVLYLLILALGLFAGYCAGTAKTKRAAAKMDAPVPIDPGYDPNNPINRREGWEYIEIDGRPFWKRVITWTE